MSWALPRIEPMVAMAVVLAPSASSTVRVLGLHPGEFIGIHSGELVRAVGEKLGCGCW